LGEIIVDARGHRCPVPTLRLRRACEAAPAGAVLRLLADDPLVRIDVPHFVAQSGMELLSMSAEGTAVVAVLRKPT
jgi:tRNA 2-thiouridine synthesizing protein A